MMAENSDIEWTDSTFNPWIGCQKVAPECDHCYAETRDQRFHRGAHWGPKAPRQRTSAQNWNKPRRWNRDAAAFMATHGRRQRVFCASLADVFDNAVAPSWRADLWDLIRECPDLDWLILTKRPQNITKMLPEDWGNGWPHVWLGTSAGTQETANKNIPALLAAPAAVRFLSAEPLLGPLDLHSTVGGTLWIGGQRGCEGQHRHQGRKGDFIHGIKHECDPRKLHHHHDERCRNGLDWVICGGESGKDARPMHPDWARSLRDQCQASGTPFLFKQWGAWKPISQMEEIEHTQLYRSIRRAKPHEDQETIDDLYGQRCTVPTLCLQTNGKHTDPLEPMSWGPGAMLAFQIGKTAAGRLLDRIEHNDFPNSPAELKGSE